MGRLSREIDARSYLIMVMILGPNPKAEFSDNSQDD